MHFDKLGFIGPKTFQYHCLAEKLSPGCSLWAPNDNDIFAFNFDLVLYSQESLNIREYAKNHRIEKVPDNLKDILILEGSKKECYECDVGIIYDGTKPFKIHIPSNNLKIFGTPLEHTNYCGFVPESEYGNVLASCNKFLYVGTKHDVLNWTKKSDWGQNEHYKTHILKRTTLGWFNGKIDIRGYFQDFVRRHQII